MTSLFKKLNVRLFTIILCLSAFCISQKAYADSTWKQIKNKDGIKVYSRKIEGSSLLAFRGVATINTSIGTLINVINDRSRHKEWVMRLAESDTVTFFSPLESIEYTHVYGIWPIGDRDVVFHSKAIINQAKGEVFLLMHSVTNPAMPEKKGIVRAELMESKYILTTVSKGKTLIEAEFHGDPKGWVPAWVANFFQRSWPFVTLKNLKEQAERLEKENLYPTYNSIFEYYLPLAEKYKDRKAPLK